MDTGFRRYESIPGIFAIHVQTAFTGTTRIGPVSLLAHLAHSTHSTPLNTYIYVINSRY